MKRGYHRYKEAKKKRELAKDDTPEIIKEIQLAYKEAFEDHKKWFNTKDELLSNRIEGEALHPEMVQDLSIFFGDAISGFPSKFKTPLEKTKK